MKIMGVDYGESRTGIALSDVTEFLASPVCTIKEKNTLKAIEKVAEKAVELKAEMIVIGHPLNMDGSRGERAQKCTFVRDEVEKLVDVPVVMWDERATTKTALNILSDNGTYGKKRKDVLDAVAATVILENFLQYRKNHRE
ncbi:MAG: Holliday junction resolvase RuvX [Oscillospiraceae bacterium]